MKIGDISERDWIRLARRYVDVSDLLSTDDDAFAMKVDAGVLVSNIDGFIPKSDRPPGMPWNWVGYKACVAAMSDVIAKGAFPLQVIVSFTFPRDFEVRDSLDILEGIVDACKTSGSKFHGGDINLGEEVVIDVVVIGISKTEVIPRHSSALREGDWVYWLGPPFGASSVALKMLLRSRYSEKDLERIIRPYFFQPEPQLDFLNLSKKRKIKASMDCSDGLAHTLCTLTEGTGLGVRLDEEAIRKHTLPKAENFLEDVFYGGEEYGIVFISEEQIDDVPLIGKLEKGELSLGDRPLECRGWDHFA